MIHDIAPKKIVNHYEPAERPDRNSYVLSFRGGKVLSLLESEEGNDTGRPKTPAGKAAGLRLELPTLSDLKNTWESIGGQSSPDAGPEKAAAFEEALIYLFSIDDDHYFLADPALFTEVDYPEAEGPGMEAALAACEASLTVGIGGWAFLDARGMRQYLKEPKHQIFAILTGVQLGRWYSNNAYCGRCGAKTELDTKERMIRCPQCGNMIFPKVQPAVIIAVTNGDKLLLTKYADRPHKAYALVAGFVEIGETLEECVAREVMEEVGMKVRNIRYYKSQPWGIDDDLLAGFFCDVDGDDTIRLDHQELKEGAWLSREEVPGEPDDYSLTNEMMMLFKAGKEPQ
ncbi:MAG: NAD(+) diphosphatase [Clostridiales bacterium]|nr:NAD(+) diphosphatase [Clostridiales bacterium]